MFACTLWQACIFPTDRADGESCSENADCKSDSCRDGFCGGSACKPSDSGSCEAGWKCIHSSPDAISAFFGSDGSDRCMPTCGHCPGNSYCAKDGEDGETLCRSGKAPLELSLAPIEVVVGKPAKLVVVVAPPVRRIASCEWEVGDAGGPRTTAGPELTHTFVGYARQGSVRVTCKGEDGSIGTAEGSIAIACQTSGEACIPDLCCERDQACLPGGGAHVCRAPAPIALTISGPTTVPINTPATYQVAMAGDGTIDSASWYVGSSISRRGEGLTFQQTFTRAELVEVRAVVQTSFRQTGEETLSVIVCQVANGSCSATTPCCGPLSCNTSTRRCQ